MNGIWRPGQTWSCSPGPGRSRVRFRRFPDDRLFVELGYEGDVIVRDLAAQSSSKPDLKSLKHQTARFLPMAGFSLD